MANISIVGADVSLGLPNMSSYTSMPMPRPGCRSCLRSQEEHEGGKCLFNTTTFQQEDLSTFRIRFGSWCNGQRIEDCLAEIVYYLGSLPK